VSVGPTSSGKRVLIVIGMHRSGTSATTGALQLLGVQLGKHLYAGHQDINAKGYFEHSDVADTNDEILFRMGSGWDDVLAHEPEAFARPELAPLVERLKMIVRRDFARSALWGVKDPRVCRLLPLWLPMLASEGIRPYFVFVVRAVGDVHRSLQRRDRFSRDKSFLLWALHYLEAERMSRGHARVFIGFERFVEQPVRELLRAERELGLRFPLDVQAHAQILRDFVSQDLRHHRGDAERDTGTPLMQLAHALEDRLVALTGASQARLEAQAGADEAAFDEIAASLATVQRAFDPILVEHIRSTALARGHLQLTMDRVMRSASWYVGKPIRFIERLFGRRV
jgi:hypothetical protein